MRKLLVAVSLIGFLLSSCKKEEIISKNPPKQEKSGRFDNSPFKWDYQSNPKSNKIFIGDLSVKTYNSINQASANTTSGSGIFIGSNNNAFPGGVYPKSRIDDFTFSSEYPYQKNAFDYYFEFNRSFILDDLYDSYGGRLKKYKQSHNLALDSKAFTDYINTVDTRSVDYSSTEISTYSDIEKNFSANASFGKIFTANMNQNKKNLKYKSIYFARLESSIFEVIFNPNYRDFFIDQDVQNDLKTSSFTGSSRGNSNPSKYFGAGEPYYIRNVSYGNYAYLAIESEYAFSEVKQAVEGTFNLWKVNVGAKYDQKTIDILSKSTVTIMMSGQARNTPGADSETFWATSMDKLSSIFSVKYNENYIGTPTYVEVRDVLTNTNYVPTYYDVTPNTRPSVVPNNRDTRPNNDSPTTSPRTSVPSGRGAGSSRR